MPAYDIYKHKTSKRRAFYHSNQSYRFFRHSHSAYRQAKRHDDTFIFDTWTELANEGKLDSVDKMIFDAAIRCASQNCE